ncbi:hypothetical protein CDEST_10070 [Colletotrichum destructivum]|uniref:Secreted protein n=1 Tax=Colletotrichum destructivum TaxID=34406 RepID=A0AAX4INF5_9PEZI|nr:hypothetical protein CDEST_10070 [Colletotrichum destructivum]
MTRTASVLCIALLLPAILLRIEYRLRTVSRRVWLRKKLRRPKTTKGHHFSQRQHATSHHPFTCLYSPFRKPYSAGTKKKKLRHGNSPVDVYRCWKPLSLPGWARTSCHAFNSGFDCGGSEVNSTRLRSLATHAAMPVGRGLGFATDQPASSQCAIQSTHHAKPPVGLASVNWSVRRGCSFSKV